ncbi:heme utilization protein HutZ [uncultured Shewanella sp.]|uniref:heme utilization protein HutZ n=1 Tax=uncultured Shewanella sp. TaxID=173975 RepID=UPI00261BCAF5|nr:heme utilization protein HutZ [uncultured Shewanella sp.]
MTQNKQQRLSDKLLPEIEAFKQECKTLQLATLNSDYVPNASYAPFALADDGFYILVSELARHGVNLQTMPAVSVMMVEDEGKAKTIFARRRLTFDTQVELIEKNTKHFHKGITALSERFGDMIDNLAGLKDFNLFKLTPNKGLYVKGFGQAFNLTGDELLTLEWKTDGHQQQGQ